MIDLLNFSKYLANFFSLGLIILGSREARHSPLAIMLLAICLILVGLPLTIYALRTMEKYKNVFDYETMDFWKKTRIGKEIREILTSLNVIGLGSFLSGLVLLVAVVLKIQFIPIIM